MMKPIPGVMLYFEDFRELGLSFQELGRLFRALLDYAEFGDAQQDYNLGPVARYAFKQITRKIDRDQEKYRDKLARS